MLALWCVRSPVQLEQLADGSTAPPLCLSTGFDTCVMPTFSNGCWGAKPGSSCHAVSTYKLTHLSGPPSNFIYSQYCSKAQMNHAASQCKGYGMTPPAIQYQSLRSAGLLQKPHIWPFPALQWFLFSSLTALTSASVSMVSFITSKQISALVLYSAFVITEQNSTLFTQVVHFHSIKLAI